jgi:hypothetical protein
MTKRRDVAAVFASRARDALAPLGFERSVPGLLYRDRPGAIDVIQAEFFNAETHGSWGTTRHSFAVTCGVFFRFAPHPGGRQWSPIDLLAKPDAAECGLRSHVVTGAVTNVWSIGEDLEALNTVVAHAVVACREQLVPWFEQWADFRNVLKLLQSSEERYEGVQPTYGFGRVGSPLRNYFLGFVAVECGERELARSALTACLEKGGFKRLSGSETVDNRIREVFCAI